MQVKEEAIDKILLIEQETNRNSQPIYQARAEAISKLPSFWKFVLLQHEVLRELVTLEDQEVLDYLEQVKASPLLECLACSCGAYRLWLQQAPLTGIPLAVIVWEDIVSPLACEVLQKCSMANEVPFRQ